MAHFRADARNIKMSLEYPVVPEKKEALKTSNNSNHAAHT